MGPDREDPAGDVPARASLWLARRDRGLTVDEADELQRWLSADPRHAAELARLEEAWRRFDCAGAAPELAAMAAELERETRLRAGRRWFSNPRALFAAAAVLALMAGVAGWQFYSREPARAPATYQVIASSARQFELPDGSHAEVREGAEIRPMFSATERRLELVSGEAHFTVVQDPARPFVVTAGHTAVRAVGTAFNVRIESSRIEVLVTQGEVVVSGTDPAAPGRPAASVIAGHRAVVDYTPGPEPASLAAVEVSAAAPSEVEQVLAWQSTRLVFDRTPLEEAVAAFNAHSSAAGSSLVIGDPELRRRRLGGTIRVANVEGFVRLLERGADVRVETRGREIVLWAR